MNKFICLFVFIALVAVSLVHGCDLMKDTKKEQEALTEFFTKHCAKGKSEKYCSFLGKISLNIFTNVNNKR